MEWIFQPAQGNAPNLPFSSLYSWDSGWGKLRIGKFTLGTVTSVLLVGVLVGQLNIAVPGPKRSVFFSAFPFCRGL